MKKFIGIVLVLCSLALPLAGCKEAISTVTCNTISELEDIPGQILSTPESAETEPEYNCWRFATASTCVKTGRTHPNSLSLLMRLKRNFRMT